MLDNDKVYTGTVVWFSKNGIGFLTPDDPATNGGKDLFVHYSNIISSGFKMLKPGEKVTFKLGTNHRGVQAVEVTPVK